jgi:hypothetical protein
VVRYATNTPGDRVRGQDSALLPVFWHRLARPMMLATPNGGSEPARALVKSILPPASLAGGSL